MADLFARLKQRKIVQWALAYVAVAWVVLQVIDLASGSYGWPKVVMHIAFGGLTLGFVVVLVLAWYHGERGIQRINGVELLIIALVLAVGGGVLWNFARAPTKAASANMTASASSPDRAQRNPGTRLPMAPDSAATAASSGLRSTVAPLAAQPIPAKSVAVLPFESLSSDKNNAYFADGMQDLILTKLADIGDLKVISRTSTMKYASHPDDLKTIGQQLGVATILEGSVQKAGNQVLINVQLIDVKTDTHIWAESYTRTLDNIFGVEGEVAEKVANALNAKLTTPESARVAKVPTRNALAYNAFLRGEYFTQRATASRLAADYANAQSSYRHAVAQDPGFALAWARLAYVTAQQIQLTDTGHERPALAAQAKGALHHALALAPNAPDVRLAQGWYDHWVIHDLKSSLASFKAVLDVQPHNAQALFGAGVIYQHLGHYRTAATFYRESATLSPRDTDILAQLGVAYLYLRDYKRAQQVCHRALAIDPNSVAAVEWLWRAYIANGELDAAQATLDAVSPELQHGPYMALLRYLMAMTRHDYAGARKAAAGMQPGGSYSPADVDATRGNIEWAAGNRDLARQYYRRAAPFFQAEVKRQPDNTRVLVSLGEVLAPLGEGKQALADIQHAITLDRARGDQNAADRDRRSLARVLAMLGESHQAIAILGDLLSRPDGFTISTAMLRLRPAWDPLRRDPAFQALLKKYGASEPAAARSGAGHG